MVKIATTHGGHYGKNMMDPGAIGNGYKEAVLVQEINKAFLSATGAKDASDFSATNVNQNLANIVSNVNRYAGANDWNVSHHFNAFNGKATGVEVWYYAGDNQAKTVAANLSKAIADALGVTNRGAKATTDLYVIRNSKGHTLLIEWCFIDNVADMRAWNANKTKAVNAALQVLGYKTGGGTTNVSKVKDNYYADVSHLVALQDLKTYDKAFKKVDNTWFIKKGTKFGVDRKRIVVTASGTTHAPIYGLSNTYVTLAKSHVKKQ